MHLDMLWICTTLCVNKAMKDIVKAETSEEDLFMHCGSTGCPDFITTCLHTVWSLTVWMDNYLNWQCRFSGTPPLPTSFKKYEGKTQHGGVWGNWIWRRSLPLWCSTSAEENTAVPLVFYTECWSLLGRSCWLHCRGSDAYLCLPWACVGSVCLCYS